MAAANDAGRCRAMRGGGAVRIVADGDRVEGVVESIDPLVAIRIRTAAGVLEVDASSARIESFR